MTASIIITIFFFYWMLLAACFFIYFYFSVVKKKKKTNSWQYIYKKKKWNLFALDSTESYIPFTHYRGREKEDEKSFEMRLKNFYFFLCIIEQLKNCFLICKYFYHTKLLDQYSMFLMLSFTTQRLIREKKVKIVVFTMTLKSKKKNIIWNNTGQQELLHSL